MALWYDARNNECRGSLVQLVPDTGYDVRFSMPDRSPSAQLTVKTWAETFPIAKTIYVSSSSQMLNIAQGGTANGYVLYTPPPGAPGILDMANAQPFDIDIAASYVIVRGLTLRGAKQDAIRIEPDTHDVVIENNDISGWGRYDHTNADGWAIGVDSDSGVAAYCGATPSVTRIIIQRNRVHDPRYGANSWSGTAGSPTYGHPAGPNGIMFSNCGGNHVFRYNELYAADEQHDFVDAMGGEDNYSTVGFPNSDSDIYGNIVQNARDDGIEAEGGDRNVRVWGNYIDQTATGVATTIVATGPAYIFRNVYNRSRMLADVPLDQDNRNVFAKAGSDALLGGGRRYLFHNTLLQAAPPPGVTYPLGAGLGVRGTGPNQFISNTISRNNIFHIWKDSWPAIDQAGSNNDFDYDLHNGTANDTRPCSEQSCDIAYDLHGGTPGNAGYEAHGIAGIPVYAAANGPASGSGGMYQLDPSSPGYDAGVPIPNFNDDFIGVAPDIGAHEAGSPPMQFGVTVPGPTAGD